MPLLQEEVMTSFGQYQYQYLANVINYLPNCEKYLLQEEVITSFGRMKTSVWRVIEAVMQVTITKTQIHKHTNK